ncbi:MAG: caspase family protein [Anaerolineae bacterium]|nr:caspase family protein [Anaerolineae bacterium]
MTRFEHGHALLVGVGADLPGTVDDAAGLAAVLRDPARCAYPPDQVHLLSGGGATRANILAALDALVAAAAPEATVLFYFSGHGYRAASSIGEAYYLIPQGYDLGKLYQTAVSGAELAARLRALAAQKVLVLLDCCHAGGVGEAKAAGLELSKAPLPGEALALLAEGRGRVLVASSQEDELSYAGKPYSAFTLALLEALGGVGVAKKDGWVRVADLALHARQVVPGRTKGKQHPVLHFEHADNFAVAYYAGGAVEPKGLPFEAAAVEIEPEPGAWRGAEGARMVAELRGSGAIAQGPGAVAAGAGGVAVGGSVHGGVIVTGDGSTVTQSPPKEKRRR